MTDFYDWNPDEQGVMHGPRVPTERELRRQNRANARLDRLDQRSQRAAARAEERAAALEARAARTESRLAGRRGLTEVGEIVSGLDLARAAGTKAAPGIPLSGLAKGIGKAISSRAGFGGLLLGAAGLGLANVAGPAARDAAFTAAFDDPNADVAFTGRKFDSRYLLGGAIGGPLGTGMQLTSPGDYFAENPIVPGQTLMSPSVGRGAAIAGAGLGVGALAGAAVGRFTGKTGLGTLLGAGSGLALGASFGLGSVPAAGLATVGGSLFGAVSGAKRGLAKGKAGIGGAIAGSLAGGAIGAGVGGALIGGSIASTAIPMKNYINENQRFFSESPYAGRTSNSIASSLNASGDIVLGMHNSRRGY